jgi:hypothetical protein
MTTGWLTIRYRDFYDFPRAVVVEWHGQLYLFDSPFDLEADDYPDTYEVYQLPTHLRDEIDHISWTDIAHRGLRIGSVPTSAVEFDQSRRHLMNPAVFQLFTIDAPNPPDTNGQP